MGAIEKRFSQNSKANVHLGNIHSQNVNAQNVNTQNGHWHSAPKATLFSNCSNMLQLPCFMCGVRQLGTIPAAPCRHGNKYTEFLLTTLPHVVLFCSFRLSGTALLPVCATGFLGLVPSRPATRRFQMWERLGHSFTSSMMEPSKYGKIQPPTSLFQNGPIRI